jgi:exodeoxyribonuclease-3
MRILSWNVNGLRAAYKKGFMDVFRELKPDIFCIQEIKAYVQQLPEELSEISGYREYFYSAEKKGYSGVAIYSKIKPLSHQFGLGQSQFDSEGRIITLEFNDFFLVNCYVPNAQPGLARIDYRKAFNDLLRDFSQELKKKKPVILCGDFNVAPEAIDLKNPKTNEENPGYSLPERQKFSELVESGFTDAFRKLYPDRVAYTWWTYRMNARQRDIGWRIDHFLVSDAFMNQVKDVIIYKDIMGSDHCPIGLVLN